MIGKGLSRHSVIVSVHDFDGPQQAQESNSREMIDTPCILVPGNVCNALATKTVFGIIDWCVGQMRIADGPGRIADSVPAQFP